MVLEDQGEFLEALDVMSLFEYRCRACGHLERSETGSVHTETKESHRHVNQDHVLIGFGNGVLKVERKAGINDR